MVIIKNSVTRFLLFVVICAVVWYLGCREKPFEPVEPTEYIFYFNDGGYFDKYYRYYSASQKVDSITIPFDSRRGLAVSPDGKRLYLANRTNCEVIDAKSLQPISQIDIESSGGVAISPDNKYLAMFGNDLRILRTSDYSVVFQDTTDTPFGGFYSRSSKTLYCAGGPGVIKVDLSNNTYSFATKAFPNLVYLVVPSVDEDKWFLYEKLPQLYTFAFEVYDLLLDSIIFQEILSPGAGDIEISPDGKFVFYTNPGTLQFGPPGASHITVYDVEMNSIYGRINTPSLVFDSLVVQHLAVSPDGRKLVGEAGAFGEFVVVDLKKMVVTESYYFGNDTINYVNLWDVACQSGL